MAAQVAPSAYGMSRSKFYLRSMLARTPSRSEYSTARMEQPAAALRWPAAPQQAPPIG